MAITREHGSVHYTCDDCGEELATGEKDFHAALHEMRAQRWENRKTNGDWEHYCPDCKSPSAVAKFGKLD